MIVEGSAREPVIVVAIGSNNCSEAVVGKGDLVNMHERVLQHVINYLIVQCVSLLVPFLNSSWRLEFIHWTLESAVDWVINAASIQTVVHWPHRVIPYRLGNETIIRSILPVLSSCPFSRTCSSCLDLHALLTALPSYLPKALTIHYCST